MDFFTYQALGLAVLSQADTIITRVLKPEQFAKVQFLNDKIDKNTNFTARGPKKYFCQTLKTAQVLAKADALVIISSALLRTHDLSV